MTAEIPQRFAEEIALRGYDDKYIDRNEEREILQIAIQIGLRLDTARAELASVCERQGYLLESGIAKMLGDKLAGIATLDRAEFDQMVNGVKELAKGFRSDRDLQILAVTVIEDAGFPRVKTGWLSNWFAKLKRELGMS